MCKFCGVDTHENLALCAKNTSEKRVCACGRSNKKQQRGTHSVFESLQRK